MNNSSVLKNLTNALYRYSQPGSMYGKPVIVLIGEKLINVWCSSYRWHL